MVDGTTNQEETAFYARHGPFWGHHLRLGIPFALMSASSIVRCFGRHFLQLVNVAHGNSLELLFRQYLEWSFAKTGEVMAGRHRPRFPQRWLTFAHVVAAASQCHGGRYKALEKSPVRSQSRMLSR